MNFEMAMKMLRQGERIKRKHWKKAYLKLEGEKLKMHMGSRNPWHYRLTNSDIQSDEWLIHVDISHIDDFAELKPIRGRLNFCD